jgi:hypothetical protein
MCSGPGQGEWIEIKLEPHAGMRGRCSQCRRPAPGRDRLPERCWHFVPLWGIPTYFHYRVSRDEQKQLIAKDGYLTRATGDDSSPRNAFVGGLHPSEVIINCPVAAHPELPAR